MAIIPSKQVIQRSAILGVMIARKDWTLLALHIAGEKGLTPAQLQKVLFLAKQNFSSKLTDFYEFKPYNYGPFDKAISRDVEELAEAGYVKLVKQPNQSWSAYRINGASRVSEELIQEADADVVKYLTKSVHWAQSISFEKLITSIYNAYPEYKVNSVFRGL
jgi:uncharacterized protein YwgA